MSTVLPMRRRCTESRGMTVLSDLRFFLPAAALSAGAADTLVDYLHLPRSRVTVIPNGVWAAAFSPATPAQRDQARELIDKGVSVLVVMAVNAYTAAEIVRDAHNAGIKEIAYDRLISNCDVDFYLSFNNYNVGKYMGEYALKLKPEGKYILLEGDKSDKNAVKVRQGHSDAIQSAVQSGKIKIVYDVFTENWDNDNAYQEMKNYLNLSSNDIPDVVLCANDGLANSTKQALMDLGINGNIVITGQDAEPVALKNIMQGKQTMTIYKPLKVLAENAVITAVKLMKNEKVEYTLTTNNSRIEVPSLLFDPVVVDKSNIKQTVVADGVVKESDIN